jgi:hypothetical protein
MGWVNPIWVCVLILIPWTSPRPSPKEWEVHGLSLLHDFFLRVLLKFSWCALVFFVSQW